MIIDQYTDLIVQENGWLAATRLGSSKVLTKTFGDSIFANTAANAVIGGTASALSGGKFANGAVGGAFRSMLFNTLKQSSNNTSGQVYVDESQITTEEIQVDVFNHLKTLIDDPEVN